MKTFGGQYAIGGLMFLFESCSRIAQAVFLGDLNKLMKIME